MGDHGSWFTVHGSRFMVHGSWFTVHGSRFTVHGSRFTVHGRHTFTGHVSRLSMQGSPNLAADHRVARVP